jgi:hypothetical protein
MRFLGRLLRNHLARAPNIGNTHMPPLNKAFDATAVGTDRILSPAEFLLEVGDLLTREEFFIEVRRLLGGDADVSSPDLVDKVHEAIGPEAERVVDILRWYQGD